MLLASGQDPAVVPQGSKEHPRFRALLDGRDLAALPDHTLEPEALPLERGQESQQGVDLLRAWLERHC